MFGWFPLCGGGGGGGEIFSNVAVNILDHRLCILSPISLLYSSRCAIAESKKIHI